MLSDCSALCCPGENSFQISRRCLRDTTWKERNWILLFWAPEWFFSYISLFLNTSLFFKCNKTQTPVYPRGLIWLNLIYHIVAGFIFHSQSRIIFYLYWTSYSFLNWGRYFSESWHWSLIFSLLLFVTHTLWLIRNSTDGSFFKKKRQECAIFF